jgi:AcrR family transcriptional regulator
MARASLLSPPPSRTLGAQRILQEARTHFFAHGFRGVTLDDLAAALHISKKTVYTHFAGKSALVAAVLNDKLRRVEEDLDEVMSNRGEDFAGHLEALLTTLRGHMAEIQPPFVRDIRRESPELFAQIQDRRRRLIHGTFGKLLEEGRKVGSVRRDIPVKVLVEMLVGAVDAVVNPPMVEELGLTPKSAFGHIIDVFLNGALVNKPGGKKR